jgi:hypothetical protein
LRTRGAEEISRLGWEALGWDVADNCGEVVVVFLGRTLPANTMLLFAVVGCRLGLELAFVRDTLEEREDAASVVGVLLAGLLDAALTEVEAGVDDEDEELAAVVGVATRGVVETAVVV